MWPAEALNLARKAPDFVYFACFFDETLFEVINFGPWICQKKIWPAMKFELYTPDLQCVMDLD